MVFEEVLNHWEKGWLLQLDLLRQDTLSVRGSGEGWCYSGTLCCHRGPRGTQPAWRRGSSALLSRTRSL